MNCSFVFNMRSLTSSPSSFGIHFSCWYGLDGLTEASKTGVISGFIHLFWQSFYSWMSFLITECAGCFSCDTSTSAFFNVTHIYVDRILLIYLFQWVLCFFFLLLVTCGKWGEWTVCEGDCGKGVSTRTFIVFDDEKNNSQCHASSETKVCDLQQECGTYFLLYLSSFVNPPCTQ